MLVTARPRRDPFAFSMGGMVAGLYAAGVSLERLDAFARTAGVPQVQGISGFLGLAILDLLHDDTNGIRAHMGLRDPLEALEELGDIPSGKASIRIGPHIITVLEIKDNMIAKVLVKPERLRDVGSPAAP